MALVPSSKINRVRGISPEQIDLIGKFMQGAIYSRIGSQKDSAFAVRDLVGGVNSNWSGTPLYALYKKHIDAGKDHEAAKAGAGKDLGWIVKSILAADKRTFKAAKKGMVSSYTWIRSPS